MQVRYDILGKIIEGKNSGWYIVVNDLDNTGGFYIYEFKYPHGDGCFDTWLETEDDVNCYIQESGWKIEWSKNLVSE